MQFNRLQQNTMAMAYKNLFLFLKQDDTVNDNRSHMVLCFNLYYLGFGLSGACI